MALPSAFVNICMNKMKRPMDSYYLTGDGTALLNVATPLAD